MFRTILLLGGLNLLSFYKVTLLSRLLVNDLAVR